MLTPLRPPKSRTLCVGSGSADHSDPSSRPTHDHPGLPSCWLSRTHSPRPVHRCMGQTSGYWGRHLAVVSSVQPRSVPGPGGTFDGDRSSLESAERASDADGQPRRPMFGGSKLSHRHDHPDPRAIHWSPVLPPRPDNALPRADNDEPIVPIAARPTSPFVPVPVRTSYSPETPRTYGPQTDLKACVIRISAPGTRCGSEGGFNEIVDCSSVSG